MPFLRFTPNLQRHVHCPDLHVEGNTVRTALEHFFQLHPKAQGYILDDQGTPHRHMAIMINGISVQDRINLSDPLSENDEIYIVQSLSGG